MDAWRLVALLLATVTAPAPADAASTHAPASGGRLLSSLLGYPSSCRHNAAAYRCTLTLTCWLVGGQLTPGCSQSGGPLDVVADLLFTCCVPSHHSHPPPPKLPPPPPLLSAPPSGLPSRREDIDHRNNQLLDVTPIECGIPQLTFQKRIIGGNEAYFGEFPWQAHIRIAGYQCGGVLVSQWYVATAAHCIHRARLKDIMVFLGEYDTQNTGQYMEPFPEETFRVIKKIIHPNFQFRITQPDRFDLALLRLSRPVFYRENILPICLPKHNEAFMGHTGVVAGWGKTDTTYETDFTSEVERARTIKKVVSERRWRGKTGTNILQKATVPILSDDECLKWHEHKNINLELYSEMFCAGHSDGHMDACLGDSGGPLIVKVNGRWTLAGITSAGFGCAVDHQPGIYHKVADTAHWIVAHVEGKK